MSHLNGNLGVGGNILTSYANATADCRRHGRHCRFAEQFHRQQQHDRVGRDRSEPERDLHASRPAAAARGRCRLDSGDARTSTRAWPIAANTTTSSINAAGNVGTLGFLPGQYVRRLLARRRAQSRPVHQQYHRRRCFRRFARRGRQHRRRGGHDRPVLRCGADIGQGCGRSGAERDHVDRAGQQHDARIDRQRAPRVLLRRSMSMRQQDLSMLSMAGAVSARRRFRGRYRGRLSRSEHRHLRLYRRQPVATSGRVPSVPMIRSRVTAEETARSLSTIWRSARRLRDASTAASIAAAISESVGLQTSPTRPAAVGAAATGGTAGRTRMRGQDQPVLGDLEPDGFSIDIAGSSSVSDVSLGTSAFITGVTINRFTASSTRPARWFRRSTTRSSTTVRAPRRPTSPGASAGKCRDRAARSRSAMSNNATLAYIDNTTINNHEVGVGAGAERRLGNRRRHRHRRIAGRQCRVRYRLSVGIITDSVNAYIENSTINGVSERHVALGRGRRLPDQQHRDRRRLALYGGRAGRASASR